MAETFKPQRAPAWVRSGKPPPDCTLMRLPDGTIEITRNADTARWLDLTRRHQAMRDDYRAVITENEALRAEIALLRRQLEG